MRRGGLQQRFRKRTLDDVLVILKGCLGLSALFVDFGQEPVRLEGCRSIREGCQEPLQLIAGRLKLAVPQPASTQLKKNLRERDIRMRRRGFHSLVQHAGFRIVLLSGD